jgi:hypothetical protein
MVPLSTCSGEAVPLASSLPTSVAEWGGRVILLSASPAPRPVPVRPPARFSHAWGTLSLGGGAVSANGWQVDNQRYQGPAYEVEYFSRRLSNTETEVTLIDVDSETRLSEIPASNCTATGSTCQIRADQKVLVRKAGEGEFTIDRNVSIARGGFFGVMSEGDLEIAGEVNGLDGV